MENITILKKKVYANYLFRVHNWDMEEIAGILDISQSQAKSYVVAGYDILYNLSIKKQIVEFNDGSTVVLENDALFMLPDNVYNQLIRNCRVNFRDLYNMSKKDVIEMLDSKCSIARASKEELLKYLDNKGSLESKYAMIAKELNEIAENGFSNIANFNNIETQQDTLHQIINMEYANIMSLKELQPVTLLSDSSHTNALLKMAIVYNLYYNGKYTIPEIVSLFSSSMGWGNSIIRKLEDTNMNFEEWADYKFILNQQIQNLLFGTFGLKIDLDELLKESNYIVYKTLKPRTGLGTKSIATILAYKAKPELVRAFAESRKEALLFTRDHFHELLDGLTDSQKRLKIVNHILV